MAELQNIPACYDVINIDIRICIQIDIQNFKYLYITSSHEFRTFKSDLRVIEFKQQQKYWGTMKTKPEAKNFRFQTKSPRLNNNEVK